MTGNARLRFLEERDGKDAALSFARGAYSRYRDHLKKYGRSLILRREIVRECLTLRSYVRSSSRIEP